MRKIALFSSLASLAIVSAVLFFSCQDKYIETYYVNEPQYLTYEDLRSSVATVEPEQISTPGKIYLKGSYIFVNEVYKGIHIINNTAPTNPYEVAFVEIPGNVDMAVKNNTLYADSYVDLVVLDISDISNITEINRLENVFPYMVMPLDDENYYPVETIDETKGVVTGWGQVKKEDAKNYSPVQNHQFRQYDEVDMVTDSYAGSKGVGGNPGIGTGGSMARFALYSNYLYTVDQSNLNVFDIEDLDNPSDMGEAYIGTGIETIFPYEDDLFIGAQTGMYIYSLENPVSPERKSIYLHMTSCDPVVVNGDYAYVTLRGGNSCGGFENQLDVLDISDRYNPVLLKSYEMTGPYGLGIDDTTLFICDGDAGLKIYNAADPMAIDENKLAEFSDINTYDVIPYNGILIMIGADGLFQYNYTDVTDIKLLSIIDLYGEK